MPVLTLVDTLRIQDFVFVSNRLRDVVAGSELVTRAVAADGWARGLGFADNVLVGAGGNLLLRFDGLPRAREFAARLTRKLYDEAPGLEVAIVHQKYEDGRLRDACKSAHEAMAFAKLRRLPPSELLGLSVDEVCSETELPAVAVCRWKGRPISRGIQARRDLFHTVRDAHNKALAGFHVDGGPPARWFYPDELDDLGRSQGDLSLMGVVHVDGNGIGEKILQWQGALSGGDADFAQRYQRLSQALDALARNTFTQVLETLRGAIRYDEDDERFYIENPRSAMRFDLQWDKEERKALLPLRPVLVSGDDLTFICDARLALALAARALASYQAAPLPELDTCVTACAGVAIVRTHDTFWRAYDLAAALCRQAKEARAKSGQDVAFIDWQIARGLTPETLEELRARHYGTELTARPYRLDGPAPSFRWLADTALGNDEKTAGFFTDRGADWAAHGSHRRRLQDLAVEGRDAVKDAMRTWQVSAPHLKLPDGMGDDGRPAGGPSALLDALELLDVYYPL